MSEVEAAFAAGYAANQQVQSAATDPMAGAVELAVPYPAEQPYIPDEKDPDEEQGGVT